MAKPTTNNFIGYIYIIFILFEVAFCLKVTSFGNTVATSRLAWSAKLTNLDQSSQYVAHHNRTFWPHDN